MSHGRDRKRLFWLLEECRASPAFRSSPHRRRCRHGPFFYPHPVPVTEQQKHSAYPGCYALSKVLEEVLLEQYYIQYNLTGCCLRRPWIMEKDDFKFTLSFGPTSSAARAAATAFQRKTPSVIHESGDGPRHARSGWPAAQRNFVHLDDLPRRS